MRSKLYGNLLRVGIGVLLLLATFTPGRAQNVEAESVPSNPKPFRNDTIRVAINVDMTALQAPNNRLAAYQATLRWNKDVVQFLGTIPALAPWNTPNLNINDVATGRIEWNDFVAGGTTDKINLLNLSFKVVGRPGDSTILNLNFTEMTNSVFTSLLPILVVKNGKVIVQNRPPDIADIAPQTMNEGATLNVAASATDPENGTIKFRVVNLPAFGAFTDNNNNTAAIRFTPDFNAAGGYANIMVIASDEGIPIKSDTTTFALTVNNVNRPPKITPLPAQITIDEGIKTEIPLSATDPDGDKISFRGRNLPAFAALLDNGNGAGVLRFTPGGNDAGDYLNLKIFATDNGAPPLSDSTQSNLKVNNTQSPLDSVRAESVPSNPTPFRNDTIRVAINVDLTALQAPHNRLAAYQATLRWNKDVVQFLGTIPALAPWNTPNLNINDVATGRIEWNDFVAGGTTDKINLLNLSFKVVGRPGDSTILNLNFTEMTNSVFTSLLPILVVKNGKVIVQNRPPDIADIAPQTMNEGATLNVAASATDPENGKIKFRVVNLPAFGAFTDNNNSTAAIRFTPDFNAAGGYANIMVIASDEGIPLKSDTTTFALTVNNVNRPPKITPLPAQITIDEGIKTEIPLSATDPDGDKISFRGRNLPAFAALLDNGNGTGVLRFTPGGNDAGDYLNLKIFATDNGAPPLSDSTQSNLKVNNTQSPLDSVRAESVPSNPTPFRNDTIRVAINVDLTALQAPHNRLAAYQATLRWNKDVVQFLGTIPALAPWNTPNLNINDVATGRIEWNDFVAGGTTDKINLLNLSFKVVGRPGDSTILNLNFTEMTNSVFTSLLPILVVKNGKVIVQNRPPDIADIAPQTMNEGATLNVAASATDPENGKIKFRVVNLPAFGAFTDNNNNTAAIRFTPDFSAAGGYANIMVIASDEGIPLKSDTTTFALTVNNVNRPPKITPLPAQITIDEGVTTEMAVSATDPDGDKIALSGKNLPTFAALLDNGNGAGVLRFSPGRNDAGNYLNLKVFATDNGVPPLADSTQSNLTVNNTQQSLVCKIEILRPRGGTICGAEVEVCVSTTITGAIGPITSVTTVNGIPAPTGCVTVPLVNGTNKIVARLTAKDALETCVAADSVTVIGRLSPLSCTLNITAPADSALICSENVDVKGTALIAGGIIPLTSKVDVNGVPATLTGNAFSVAVKLTPGWNTLIATFAVTDSCNNTAVCRDTIRVRSLIDKIAPGCAFTPGYKSVTGTLFDHESGIAKVEALFLFNAKLTVDPFTPGAKQVKFRLDDLGQESYLGFDIKITDLCGNTHICDPVFLQLTADRANNPYVFKFRSIDRYFQLTNKGLTEVRVELNGKRFSFSTERRGGSVQSLGVYAMPVEGEVMLDLQTYLRDSGDNDIRIEVTGPAGSSAELLLVNEIHDADHALALQELPLAYALSQNYPNPFNPETVIRFGIPTQVTAGTPAAPVGVQLRIYNMLGEVVRTLVDQPMQPGSYTARWNGRNDRGVQVAAGVYIYRIVAGDYRAAKRMLMLK